MLHNLSGTRMKTRPSNGDAEILIFSGNNFEGCLRVPQPGDSDGDGNVWWTVWPEAKHNNARELLTWYAAGYPQQWVIGTNVVESVAVPQAHLDVMPTIIGGPE